MEIECPDDLHILVLGLDDNPVGEYAHLSESLIDGGLNQVLNPAELFHPISCGYLKIEPNHWLLRKIHGHRGQNRKLTSEHARNQDGQTAVDRKTFDDDVKLQQRSTHCQHHVAITLPLHAHLKAHGWGFIDARIQRKRLQFWVELRWVLADADLSEINRNALGNQTLRHLALYFRHNIGFNMSHYSGLHPRPQLLDDQIHER
mmetsp:Transcript_34507/g.75504  ORF Transcript_34507/g.75504 Transcript_34507/m.75504 type:complete len:203 (-) Transcript_34507:308-916(-)